MTAALLLALSTLAPAASAELIRHEGYRNDGTRIAGSVTVGGESTEIGKGSADFWTRVNAWTWSHVDEHGDVDGTSMTDPAKVAAGHWERSGEELRWRLSDGSFAVGLIRVPSPDGSGDMQWSYGRPDGEIVRGTFCVTDGGTSHTYIADRSGRLLLDGTGWVRVPKITSGKGSSGVGVYYTDGTHAAVSGLFSVEGKAYYVPPELGYTNFGEAERDGWLMLSDDAGSLPSHEGWFGPGAANGGEMHYVTRMDDVDGVPVYAERSDGASGLPAQAMLPVLDGRRYVVCERKDLPSGFVTKGGKTFYFDPKTHKAVRWEQVIDGRLYYFDKGCVMHRGWLTWNKDGSRSYFGADGAAVSGWKNDGNKRYYLSPKTFHSVRWTQVIDGKTYYFDGNYAMHTGWLQWVKGANKGKWSYFGSDGVMATGKRTIDGRAYDFGNSGMVTTGPVGRWDTSGGGYVWVSASGARKTCDGMCYDAWKRIKNARWRTDGTDGVHGITVKKKIHVDADGRVRGGAHYCIAVDVDRARVNIFKWDGKTWEPYNSYYAYVGRHTKAFDANHPKSTTPTGNGGIWYIGSKFHYNNSKKINNHHTYWSGFGCKGHGWNNEDYFHTIPGMKEKLVKNGGKNNTAGCIVLPEAWAKWIYENCGTGTPVYCW